MDILRKDALMCIANWVGNLKFQVRVAHGAQYAVDL